MLNDKYADNRNGVCSKIQPSKIGKFWEWCKKENEINSQNLPSNPSASFGISQGMVMVD